MDLNTMKVININEANGSEVDILKNRRLLTPSLIEKSADIKSINFMSKIIEKKSLNGLTFYIRKLRCFYYSSFRLLSNCL